MAKILDGIRNKFNIVSQQVLRRVIAILLAIVTDRGGGWMELCTDASGMITILQYFFFNCSHIIPDDLCCDLFRSKFQKSDN